MVLDEDGDVDVDRKSEFEVKDEKFDVAPVGRMGGSIIVICYAAY